MVIHVIRHSSKNTKFEFEEEALKGCRSLIHKSAKLVVCPDTGRKFILDTESSMKIILDGNKVTISNGDKYREIIISEKGKENINRIFNGQLKKIIFAVEEKIHSSAQDNLTELLILTSY